jgi:hypothetical protein
MRSRTTLATTPAAVSIAFAALFLQFACPAILHTTHQQLPCGVLLLHLLLHAAIACAAATAI